MKHLVLILSALFLCNFNLQAEEKKIELEKKGANQNNYDRTDFSTKISVIQDKNLLLFSSEENINELYFEVKTVTGITITSETFSLVAGQTYTTTIGEVESDVYILEVKINGEIYCGYLGIY